MPSKLEFIYMRNRMFLNVIVHGCMIFYTLLLFSFGTSNNTFLSYRDSHKQVESFIYARQFI